VQLAVKTISVPVATNVQAAFAPVANAPTATKSRTTFKTRINILLGGVNIEIEKRFL
jgi:hypothetical protein